MDRAHFPTGLGVANRAPADHRRKGQGHTYTTAGTIYDPNAVAPLQPPARRGRAMNRWGTGGAQVPPELLLLSSDFETARGARGRNMTSNPVTQHSYRPLQQNYDRAISPVGEPVGEPERDSYRKKDMSVPYLGAGNELLGQTGSGETAALMADDENKKVAPAPPNPTEEMEDQDVDDEMASKSLDQLPVKALFNLMSYPNPNQEQARKRWEEARQGGGSAQAQSGPFASRAAYVESLGKSPLTSFDQHSFVRERIYPTRRSAVNGQMETVETRVYSPPYRPPKSTAPASHTSHIYQPVPIHAASRQRASESFELSGNLATGPGAPRPLTAGPPGQRQYRPCTFESTVRALRGNSHMELQERQGYVNMTGAVSHTRTETGVSQGESTSMSDLSADSEPLGPTIRRPVGAIGPPSKTRREVVNSVENIVMDADSWTGSLRAPDKPRFPPPFSRQPPARTQPAGEPRDGVTMTGLKTVNNSFLRGEKAHRCWRSGSERWRKAVEDQIQNLLNDVGPGAEVNKSAARVFSKPQLTAEEAHTVLTSEHCRPILTMALDNIERFLDHYGWGNGNGKGPQR